MPRCHVQATTQFRDGPSQGVEAGRQQGIMSMLSSAPQHPSLSQQQQLFSADVRAALSPAPQQLSAQDAEDDRPVLIPCATANAGISLHRSGLGVLFDGTWPLH